MTANLQPRPCTLLIGKNESSGNHFTDVANGFREALKDLEIKARDFTDYIKTSNGKMASLQVGDVGETIAQSIIAMRHLEDARMRYGKVIQYIQDGVSIYDKQSK